MRDKISLSDASTKFNFATSLAIDENWVLHRGDASFNLSPPLFRETFLLKHKINEIPANFIKGFFQIYFDDKTSCFLFSPQMNGLISNKDNISNLSSLYKGYFNLRDGIWEDCF